MWDKRVNARMFGSGSRFDRFSWIVGTIRQLRDDLLCIACPQSLCVDDDTRAKA